MGRRSIVRTTTGLPFGPHPHRGFETVTFILDGELMHRDSAGHESVIRGGGVQWMTAGAGVGACGVVAGGIQEDGRSTRAAAALGESPRATQDDAASLPGTAGARRSRSSRRKAASCNVIAGEWGGAIGPVTSITHNFMSTASLESGARLDFDGLSGRNVFLYIISGAVRINGRDVAPSIIWLSSIRREIESPSRRSRAPDSFSGMASRSPSRWPPMVRS